MIPQDFIAELQTFNTCLKKLNTITNELPNQLKKFYPDKEHEAEQVEQFLNNAQDHMFEIGKASTAPEDKNKNLSSAKQTKDRIAKIADHIEKTEILLSSCIALINDNATATACRLIGIVQDDLREATDDLDVVTNWI